MSANKILDHTPKDLDYANRQNREDLKREREVFCHECNQCRDPEGKFFIPYDLDFGLPQCYETLDEALKEAAEIFKELMQEAYCEGWHEDMELFVITNYEGHVLYHFRQTDLILKPDDLDADGYSPSLDMNWLNENWDYICNYDLVEYEGVI